MELYAIDPAFAVTYLETIENASLEERAAAFNEFGDKQLPDIVSRIEGSTEAVIHITGPMSPKGPSPIARFFGFGGTGYEDIIAAAKSLENDPSIVTVRAAMDTPGGTIAGMDLARQALVSLAAKKILITENHGVIASAGYYLATAAPRIEAKSALSVSGSIGIIAAGIDSTEALARNGLKRIKIISKNAPNKQPDPATTEGRSVIQEHLNSVERVFIDVIASGRNTTAEDVIANFGKGGMLVAQDPDQEKPDALKAGMIDSVVNNNNTMAIDEEEDEISADHPQQNNSASNGATTGDDDVSETQAAESGQQEGIVMDLNKLKAEHPDLFAEAVAVGVTQERERVEAHLTMGKASGDMDFAVSCIGDGSQLTASVNAKYYAAGMDKGSIAARGAEAEGDLDTPASDDADAKDEELAAATAEVLGVERA